MPIKFIIVGICIVILAIMILIRYIKNIFNYPQITNKIDLSGRRKPSYSECIEEWMIQQYNAGKSVDSMFQECMIAWENDCKSKMKRSFLFKKRRQSQFNKMQDKIRTPEYKMFSFIFYRVHQGVEDIENTTTMTIQEVSDIDDALQAINYKATQDKYNEQNQRKLMTSDLRKQIKERDNYTCKLCGISKQFLDDLCPGLGDYLLFEIDHIQPVSQGGVTVDLDNLQCLCWRCNRAKGGDKTNADVSRNLTYGIRYLHPRRH